jgi:hypothetical protein
VRVLADPLRLKLLGAFGACPRTTKQVARLLGEKPTKLYHHVETLERIGLLVLKETRPNRGTLEKYYQAVATRFQVGPAVFSGPEGSGEAVDPAASVLISILDTTREEMTRALNSRGAEGRDAEQALVARALVRVAPERVARLRARLLAVIDRFEAEGKVEKPGEKEVYALTVAFYPVPRPDQGAR